MFLSYLKRHYKIIILFGLFIIIFAAVFSLYELEVEAVLYAAVLCLFVGIIAFAFVSRLPVSKKSRTSSSTFRTVYSF